MTLLAAGLLVICAPSEAAQPGNSAPAFQAWPQLHTPDQITPAVLPYLACLYAQRGLPPLQTTDGAPVTFDKSGDCSAARSRASANAAKLLEGKPPTDGSSPAGVIERTLADIDAYVASLPTLGSGGTGGQAVVGVPVMIEDEIQPAYARYDDCLKTQISDSRVSAETIMSKFREAMTTCANVRELAVSEATKALASKGWDEATRARAAKSTFAKVDESWLALGRQYQQLLIEKGAEEAAKPKAAH